MSIKNFTGVNIGSKSDNDQVLRQMGFYSSSVLAKYTCPDGISYSVISMGEQRVYGLPGSGHEGKLITNNPEYVFENLEALSNSGCFDNSCWLSIDCNDEILDFTISDELVVSSIKEAFETLKLLDEHLSTNGTHQSFWIKK